ELRKRRGLTIERGQSAGGVNCEVWLERVASGDVPQVRPAGLDGTLLCGAVDGDNPEFWLKAKHPFPLIEQAPGDVATYVAAVVNGTLQTHEGAAIIFDAAGVISRFPP